MPSRSLIVGSVLLLFLSAAAAARGELETQLNQILDSADLRDTRVSVMVEDIDAGVTLARINPDARMIPASNMKLVTTAAALDVLGPSFLFRTELGLLEADAPNAGAALIVRGDGDPGFGDPVLLEANDPPYEVDDVLRLWIEAVADAAQDAGLERFEHLVVDDRVFDRQFVHPTWPQAQLNRHYAAEVAGINFNRNCIDIRLLPANRPGQAPAAEIYPAAPFIRITNRATTGNSDSYWFSRTLNDNRFTFHGTVQNRPGQATPVTVHDPPMFFGRLLAHRLSEDAGIAVLAVERVENDDALSDFRSLHRVQTTLAAVLQRINSDSQNMFAEALLKRMGRALTGAPGSWENGAAAVRLALNRRLGTESANLRIADGSGLSRDNRLSAELLVRLLVSVHNDNDREKADMFRQSLAIGGRSGTLSNRMSDIDATVHAKSGYIRGVSALSGYVAIDQNDDRQPRNLAFSFLFNDFAPPLYNHQMRNIQDRMLKAIVDSVSSSVEPGG